MTATVRTSGSSRALDRLTSRPRASYEAVSDAKKRRAVILASSLSEDKELPQDKRRKLLSTARDVQRNFAIAAWAIRKHLDFVSRFTFQCRSGDAAFDTTVENRVARWSRADACDAAGRHSLPRIIRLMEQCALLDGDCGLLMLADGRVQLIESDRICDAQGLDRKPERLVQGIETDKAGRPVRYCIARRDVAGMQFDLWALAQDMILRGYFHRADQLRGITPLSAGLNSMRDLHENFELALTKAKLHNVMGLAFLRKSTDANDGMTHLNAETGEEADETAERYEVDLAGGPFKIELDQGDDIKFLESQTPSAEFKNFAEFMIRSALLCCDIPYTFFDVKGSTYSGARQDLLQYYQSASVKRADIQEVLDRLTRWQLTRWAARGEISPPTGLTIDDIVFEWIPAGLPWIDPVKEVKANAEAVKAGFTSTVRVCREHGDDAFEIAAEEAAYQAHLRLLGLSGAQTAPSADEVDESDEPAKEATETDDAA
jgi:lambda family phage portal protein